MNNFELDRRAKELAASNSGYNLARRFLMLEDQLAEARREAAGSVPEIMPDEFDKYGERSGHGNVQAFVNGWNECRCSVLAAYSTEDPK